MSDVKTTVGAAPALNRTSRDAELRAKITRRRPWQAPSRLDAPEPPPGYKHRWIRAESAGIQDRTNVAGRLREGYELVRADEYPDFHSSSPEDGRHAGVISVGALLLARIPEETVEDGGISGNLRKQAADCETQLMRMIDGSAGLGMREIYVEAQTKRIVANGASSVTRRADTAKGPKTRSQAWSLRLTAWACCSLNHAPRASRAS